MNGISYIDITVAIILLIAALRGWKTGGISSLINLIGTLLVIVVSYYIKDPVSVLLYKNLPFFSFDGLFAGITSINIIVYEAISYLICCGILGTILALVIKITGLVDKIVNKTLIISLPSKLLGVVASCCQYYIFCFVVIFILAQIPFTAKSVQNSITGPIVLEQTPGISAITSDLYHTVTKIYDIAIKADGEPDKTQADYDALEVLLKYKVISSSNAKQLVDDGKIAVANADELINKYKDTTEV